jgi:hypothetical protein
MSLHDTIEMTKKALLFGAIGIGIIIVLFFLFRFGVFLKNTLFPTPPPPINASFGKLPAISFPKQEEKTAYTYTLDTISGDYPAFPDRVLVYKIIPEIPQFYDLARAKVKAKNIGFEVSPVPILENVYQWSENDGLQRKLIMNTLTKDFTLISAYKTFPPVEQATHLGNADSAKEAAMSFFETLNSYPETINAASTSAKLFTLQGGELVEAASINTAQIVRVDFYRREVNSLPIYNPNFPDSLIYALIGGGTTEPEVVEAQYADHNISEEASDYPIKTAEQAFSELQAGKGYVATAFGKATDIHITEIHLGYYLGKEAQEYLLPVIVFQGENDEFTAYVPAIPDSFNK